MIVYGLTGSIGMGKSTAANMLRRMGVPVHDSDAEVHNLMRPDGKAFEEVAVTFPEAWDQKKHLIKRDVLADIIFNDDEKREILETPVVVSSGHDIPEGLALDESVDERAGAVLLAFCGGQDFVG